MIEFNISAPGRIVLSGDHAAMYEKRVVMASLDRRTTLKFCELPDEQGIKIDFPEVELSLSIPLGKVRNFYLNNITQDKPSNLELLRIVKYFISINSMWCVHEQRFSLQIFFLLLFSIAYTEDLEIRSFHVDVSTDLPISGGLGGSTSFAVCLAACFIHWARLQKGAHDKLDEDDLKKICTYSTNCEECIQDYAVSFDNKVCTYGKIANFQYSNFEDYDMSTMDVSKMKILLIDSNILRSNRERVQRMAELKHSNPDDADSILRRVNEISEKICRTLNEMTNSKRNHFANHSYSLRLQRSYARLQKNIQDNQNILHDSNLSHPTLDNICSIAQKYGFAGKVTGFGGGFVYIPVAPSIQRDRILKLSTKLLAANCDVKITSVSCSGVRIDE